MNGACATSMPAMPLFNEHSTACPITPANPSPQVLEIVAVESGQGACPQTDDFGQAAEAFYHVSGKDFSRSRSIKLRK
jgi:hypothetical protein